MKKLTLIVSFFMLLGTCWYFLAQHDYNNPYSDCRVTECSNNVSEVCCSCEVDGPHFFVETDTNEKIAQCGDWVSGDYDRCNVLAEYCR